MEEVTVGANGRGRYAQRGGPDVADLAIELIEHHLGHRFQFRHRQPGAIHLAAHVEREYVNRHQQGRDHVLG